MCKLFMILFVFSINILPCSTFCLKNDSTYFVGKNYDWDVENGRIFINKRNVQKVAFKVDNPVSWTSKYGSITFNQYGQDFPIGGMNEKGLVIEALWLNETVYPQPDGTRQNIDNMQWIQFHLDNSYDINDVIKNDSSIQFSPTSASAVHCFITDKFGKSLIFESVNGTTYHFKTDNNNFPFLTNDSYEKSVRMINRCKLFGGNLDIPEGNGSITRFIHIGIALKNYNRGNANPIDYSFNILKNVSMGNYTKWTIVYDLNNLSISYRTKTSRGLKIIKMNSFNLNCSDETISINIINNYKEDVSKFFIFTPIELNKKMVLESFRNTPFLMNIKPEYVEAIYKYPSNFKCK